MNPTPDNWKPDPQLLAAFFDGELEGRDDVADVRARIEAWLEGNPEAADAWHAHQQLTEAWQATTPAEPGADAWKKTLDRIESARRRPSLAPPTRRPGWSTAAIAAGIALAFGLAYGLWLGTAANQGVHVSVVRTPGPLEVEDLGVLPVASASDVTILRIDDADVPAIVVGTFPVSGPLELADSGEVCISCKCPRVVVRQDPPHRPMVYARADLD